MTASVKRLVFGMVGSPLPTESGMGQPHYMPSEVHDGCW